MRLHDGTTLDRTGEVFGLLTVVDRAPSDVFGRVYWNCICRCGASAKKCANQLRNGKFFTCGKPECRFWEKVYIPEGDSCWEWTGALNDSGYGAFRVNGKKVPAHVYAWTMKNGPVPEGMIVRHKVCDFRPCVREDHLLLGTHADNMRDMVEHGRSRSPKDRISLVVKQRIREGHEEGLTYADLMEIHNVSYSTVTRTLRGAGATTGKD